MTTVRKIVTCQLNAGQSSGPRTAEGREKSAENARVHGLRARKGLMPWESLEEHAALRARLWAELSPVGWQEEVLAESIVRTSFRQRRLSIGVYRHADSNIERYEFTFLRFSRRRSLCQQESYVYVP